jgi:hypothetical protein
MIYGYDRVSTAPSFAAPWRSSTRTTRFRRRLSTGWRDRRTICSTHSRRTPPTPLAGIICAPFSRVTTTASFSPPPRHRRISRSSRRARAEALIVRAPHAPPAEPSEACRIVPLAALGA